MRLDKIPTGNTPPQDINVIIEVPVGGEPNKWLHTNRWGDAAEPKPMIVDAIARSGSDT